MASGWGKTWANNRYTRFIKIEVNRILAIRIKEDPSDKAKALSFGDCLFLASIGLGVALTVNIARFVVDHI